MVDAFLIPDSACVLRQTTNPPSQTEKASDMFRTSSLALAAVFVASMASGQSIVAGVDFLATWDADSDGKVTLAEVAERRASLWALFDENGDGIWQAGDLKLIDEHIAAEAEAKAEIMKANDQVPGFVHGMGAGANGGTPGAGAGAGTVNISSLSNLDLYDTDKNGILTEAEWNAGAPIWFKIRDRNADGVLDMADFGPVL
jgi:hypothetical protein